MNTIPQLIDKLGGSAQVARIAGSNIAAAAKWKARGSIPVKYWRPQRFWTEERENTLMAWIHAHSFVSAHTDQGDWEQWMEERQRVVPIHGQAKEKAAFSWPPSLYLAAS